jgi:hypothetical protein
MRVCRFFGFQAEQNGPVEPKSRRPTVIPSPNAIACFAMPRSTAPRFLFAAGFLLSCSPHVINQIRIAPPALFRRVFGIGFLRRRKLLRFLARLFSQVGFCPGWLSGHLRFSGLAAVLRETSWPNHTECCIGYSRSAGTRRVANGKAPCMVPLNNDYPSPIDF